MKIAKISGILPHSKQIPSARNFNGYWSEVRTVEQPYTSYDAAQKISTYYPDRDESIDDINSAYMAKTGNRSIGSYPYPSSGYDTPYTKKGVNYIIDDRKSWELKKVHLAHAAMDADKSRRYPEAINYKIRIANILEKQHRYDEKNRVEQSIKRTYNNMNSSQRAEVNSDIMEYDPNLAGQLLTQK